VKLPMLLNYISVPEFAGFPTGALGSMVSTVKDIAQTVQAVVTVLAIFVGAYWAYSRFIKGRLAHPHANIAHEVTHLLIGNEKALLRVTVTIQNVGNVLLTLGESTLRIQQILPLPAEVVEAIEQGKNPVNDGETEVRWPLIESRELDLANLPIKLEPGESDEIVYDFFVDGCPKTVKVYSYYSSAVNARHRIFFRQVDPLGWKRTTTYDFVPGEDAAVSSAEN